MGHNMSSEGRPAKPDPSTQEILHGIHNEAATEAAVHTVRCLRERQHSKLALQLQLAATVCGAASLRPLPSCKLAVLRLAHQPLRMLPVVAQELRALLSESKVSFQQDRPTVLNIRADGGAELSTRAHVRKVDGMWKCVLGDRQLQTSFCPNQAGAAAFVTVNHKALLTLQELAQLLEDNSLDMRRDTASMSLPQRRCARGIVALADIMFPSLTRSSWWMGVARMRANMGVPSVVLGSKHSTSEAILTLTTSGLPGLDFVSPELVAVVLHIISAIRV